MPKNQDHESALALAIATLPAKDRPEELQAAIGIAFNTLGLFALTEKESKS